MITRCLILATLLRCLRGALYAPVDGVLVGLVTQKSQEYQFGHLFESLASSYYTCHYYSLHIVATLGRRLEEQINFVVIAETNSILVRYLTPTPHISHNQLRIMKVSLVAHQNRYHILMRIVPHLTQVVLEGLQTLPTKHIKNSSQPRHTVHQEYSRRSTIKRSHNGFEGFLTCLR